MYGPSGNLTSRTSGSVTTSFGYDEIDQLISEARSGYSCSYTYDSNGNRLTKVLNGVTESYSYDDGDKLLSAGSKTYSYDAMGRCTSIVNGASTTNLSYDYESRLLGTSGSVTTSSSYNAFDARVSHTNSSGTKSYRRDGVSVTSPLTSDGSATYTPGISERRGSTSKFYHSDRLGSVQKIAGSNQSVTDTRTFDAFGLTETSSGSTPTPFGFAGDHGYQSDSDTGLQLLGHRYYDPSTGRFLTRDPAAQGRNWYAYCGNNPVKRIDTNGASWREVGGLAGGIIGGLLGGGIIGGAAGTAVGSFLGSLADGDSAGDAALNGAVDGGVALVSGAVLRGLGKLGKGALGKLLGGAEGAATGAAEGAAAEGLAGALGGAAKGVGGGAIAGEPITMAEATYESLLSKAQKLYKSKAGKFENHHIAPKYLGGSRKGATVRIDAAYHQCITNAFYKQWKKGLGVHPSAEELQKNHRRSKQAMAFADHPTMSSEMKQILTLRFNAEIGNKHFGNNFGSAIDPKDPAVKEVSLDIRNPILEKVFLVDCEYHRRTERFVYFHESKYSYEPRELCNEEYLILNNKITVTGALDFDDEFAQDSRIDKSIEEFQTIPIYMKRLKGKYGPLFRISYGAWIVSHQLAQAIEESFSDITFIPVFHSKTDRKTYVQRHNNSYPKLFHNNSQVTTHWFQMLPKQVAWEIYPSTWCGISPYATPYPVHKMTIPQPTGIICERFYDEPYLRQVDMCVNSISRTSNNYGSRAGIWFPHSITVISQAMYQFIKPYLGKSNEVIRIRKIA